jgi:hypothetical protein
MDQLIINILISKIRSFNEDEFTSALTNKSNWENLLLELNELQKNI